MYTVSQDKPEIMDNEVLIYHSTSIPTTKDRKLYDIETRYQQETSNGWGGGAGMHERDVNGKGWRQRLLSRQVRWIRTQTYALYGKRMSLLTWGLRRRNLCSPSICCWTTLPCLWSKLAALHIPMSGTSWLTEFWVRYHSQTVSHCSHWGQIGIVQQAQGGDDGAEFLVRQRIGYKRFRQQPYIAEVHQDHRSEVWRGFPELDALYMVIWSTKWCMILAMRGGSGVWGCCAWLKIKSWVASSGSRSLQAPYFTKYFSPTYTQAL